MQKLFDSLRGYLKIVFFYLILQFLVTISQILAFLVLKNENNKTLILVFFVNFKLFQVKSTVFYVVSPSVLFASNVNE